MELPSHPDADDTGAAPPDDAGIGNRTAMIVLWAVAAIVVVVIVLHLTGVVGPLSQ